jgi:hypothetical protein
MDMDRVATMTKIEKIDFRERYKSLGFIVRVKDIRKLIEVKIHNNRKGRSYDKMTANECGYEYALNELLDDLK